MDANKRHRYRRRAIAALTAVGLLALTGGCSGPDNVGEGSKDIVSNTDTADAADTSADTAVDTGSDVDTTAAPPDIRVSPPELRFEGIAKGESESVSVTIRNVGGTKAVVSGITVEEQGNNGDSGEFEISSQAQEPPFEVGADLFEEFEVTYAPTDFATDRALVTIDFRGEVESVEIPIQTVNAHPDIDAPTLVRFGSVETGKKKSQRVTLFNRGMTELDINDVSFEGDSNFSLDFPMGANPFPTAVGQDDSFYFDLVFDAPDDKVHRGQLVIKSSDPDEGEYRIDVTANRPTPCIELSTSEINFGDVTAGKKTEKLGILNCSRSRTLEVTNVDFAADGNGAFTLGQVPEFPYEINPAQQTEITVSAELERDRKATGLLVVRAKDTDKGSIFVDLLAERGQ